MPNGHDEALGASGAVLSFFFGAVAPGLLALSFTLPINCYQKPTGAQQCWDLFGKRSCTEIKLRACDNIWGGNAFADYTETATAISAGIGVIGFIVVYLLVRASHSG